MDQEFYDWSCDGSGASTSTGNVSYLWTYDATPPGWEDIVKLLARHCITNLPQNVAIIVIDKNNWQSYTQHFNATGDAPIERYSRQEGILYYENGEPRYGVSARQGNSVFIVVCTGIFKQGMELQAAEIIGHELIHAYHYQEHPNDFDVAKSEYASYDWSRRFWVANGQTGRANNAQTAQGAFNTGLPYYKSTYNPAGCP